ncbi:MAG: hypothetical protein JXR95_12155 [Deltaproteobacteria bacterium]|nr:hypothetical protein [Deltaproteobacteria bacterium]
MNRDSNLKFIDEKTMATTGFTRYMDELNLRSSPGKSRILNPEFFIHGDEDKLRTHHRLIEFIEKNIFSSPEQKIRLLASLENIRETSLIYKQIESWGAVELSHLYRIISGMISLIELFEDCSDSVTPEPSVWTEANKTIRCCISGGLFKIPSDLNSRRLNLTRELQKLTKNFRESEQRYRHETSGLINLSPTDLRLDLAVGFENKILREKLEKSERFVVIEETAGFSRYRMKLSKELNTVSRKIDLLQSELSLMDSIFVTELSLSLYQILIKNYEDCLSWVGKIDLCCAQLEWAIQNNCFIPELSKERELRIKDGCHPFIKRTVEISGGFYYPVTTIFDEPIVSVSGVNMGGKSSFLRTIGLMQCLFQFGAPVPAKEYSSSLFSHIAWQGSHPDDSERGLSSFGVEITELVRSLERSKSLYLFDEFARSTDVETAQALTWGLFQYFRARSEDLVIFAGHLHMVGSWPGITSLRAGMLKKDSNELLKSGNILKNLNNLIDYSISLWENHHDSDAIVIARALGLNEEIIYSASEFAKN